MKKTLNEIKDRIYEAEGLLELLQLRGDRLHDLVPLILARIDEARERLVSMSEHEADAAFASQPIAGSGDPVNASDSGVNDPVSDKDMSQGHGPQPVEAEPAVSSVRAAAQPLARSADRPAFCLNDRFRFRRAIFAGSQEDFNMAMDHLATLDSYEEAEDFFIGDMALDPEDQDVADFMNVIKEYFGQ